MNTQDERAERLQRIGRDAMASIRKMVDATNRGACAEAYVKTLSGSRSLGLEIKGTYRDGEWTADAFVLLLATGGPAVRIVGDIDHRGEPSNPQLETQDWWTPWTKYETTREDDEALETYCRCFCFEVS